MRTPGGLPLFAAAGMLALSACGGGSGATSAPQPTSSPTPRPSVVAPSRTLDELAALVTRRAPDVLASAPALLVHLRVGTGERTLAFGAATVTPRRAVRADDTVMLASLTKPIVATLALQLVGQGRLQLSDTVEKWLPGALKHGSEVTVEQLLSMTSGLPTYDTAAGYPGGGKLPASRLLDLVKDDDLQFVPGTAAQESNTNYVVLGLVVERAGGAPLAAQLGTRVAKALSVSALGLGGTPSAHGYAGATDATVVAPRYPSAAAGGVASVPAYTAFFDALLSGRLVPAAQLAEMQRPRQEVDGQPYGLGLRVRETPCGTAYGQAGGNDGYALRVWSVPAAGRTVLVAITDGGQEGAADQVVDEVLCA